MKPATTKGEKAAEGLLQAAIACLGKDGYAGTSLQRVADEAGTQKRMVLYYYGSREQLMASALRRLAEEFLADLEERLGDVDSPVAIVDTAVDLLLEQADQRPLLAAYYGLFAESATDAVLAGTLAEIREQAVALAHRVLDRVEAAGHQLSMERELLILSASITAHGLGLELLHRGRTPEFDRLLTFARVGAPMFLFD